jgi:3-oxoacyl-[acyl-carrier protein] reductase
MIDLSDSHVLVTGGSRGIGAACCRFFARAGATVMVHYRDQRKAAETVLAEVQAEHEAPHLLGAADLMDPAQIQRLVSQVQENWGRLDCLVNNAGVWLRNPLAQFDLEALEATWKLNLRGPILAAGQVLGLLRDSSDGSIVNISSTAGQRGEAFYSPYAASKGALIALTKSWAVELAPEVRVNSVAPGWVDTDMSEPVYGAGGKAAIEETIPLGRTASPEDIAGSVLFLASPLARHITGEILNVNGGAVLCG